MAQSLLLGTRKGLLRVDRDSGQWRLTHESHEGIPVTYAFHDPRRNVTWASLNHGHWGAKLQRSEDFGQSWTEIPAPAYPEGAQLGDDSPATLKDMWVIAPGGEDRPDRVFIGTEPGGLFVSEDGGETFRLVESLWNHPSRKKGWFGGGKDHPAIHSVLVDPRNSDRILIGISCAGVFESTDNGASFHPRNKGLPADFLPDPTVEVGHDPHLLAHCPASPDNLWQQNHCGLYRSRDGGASWTETPDKDGPAGFGFAIAVDPEDSETAWVAPAKSDQCRTAIGGSLVISRTRDGGSSWEPLRKGLPQEACYDLVYRHALDLEGDTLAFGTTNGNLYISEDRGDSWSAVGHCLPPIYSVRFAPKRP